MTIIQEAVNFSLGSMSYPDFLGFLGIDNTPPGSIFTLDYWTKNAKIDKQSVVLDLACSTGFTARNVSERTQCTALGVDISESSIKAANALALESDLSSRVQFSVGNAEQLTFKNNTFSHVTAGCCFGFFHEKQRALEEVQRTLKKDGFLCVSPFFYESEPNDQLLDLVQDYIGYRPEKNRNYHYWRLFFNQHFSIVSEELFDLPAYSDHELEAIVNSSLSARDSFRSLDTETRQIVFDRYYNTRVLLNEHAKYQSVALWVLKVLK